jgi:internalin A
LDTRAASVASGDELRLLRALLLKEDHSERWGRLKKYMTKEGHWLWLCSEHLKVYQD